MGSRGRSIRLRIYFLVAIPLITMLGLFGYVAYTSITTYLNLDRAPNLIRATSEPLTAFVTLLQNERRAAVIYLAAPNNAADLAGYQNAIRATEVGELQIEKTVTSTATTSDSTPAETAAIQKMITDVTAVTGLRSEVTAKRIPMLDAFVAYTKVITDQDTVFQAETSSMTETVASAPGFGLLSAVNAREDLDEQDAILAAALASRSLTGPERVAFSQAAGRQVDDTLLYTSLFTAPELKIYDTAFDAAVPATMQNDLATVQQGVEAGLPLTALERLGLSSSSWQTLTSTWVTANYQADTDAANSVLAASQQLATTAKDRVWETAAVGAAGLILTLLVTILLGRSINRRLTTLRRSALMLAQEQLPAVVARLRRGESVDVAAEAPSVRMGADEIGQVGQAIDAVRQTAIRSAIDEARVRQGVNDMFRNLARRNQSLLQRQLSVLDDMERRATDPDVLEDLFKMDHLTTRMRRHAEGLIILSGAPPGRSWSAPVKLIDVMRGAVAEVEDYARVTVSTQARAALSGSAVTDVIHLLAELIENATSLSPPFTQVRVGGESVASGFAIEIEDRGLGMTPQRLAELNDRLANPPDINPANTEQLGLFVVGQLGRRHRISVTLRPSPYGGTSAVVLIPGTLIVDEGPAALAAGGVGAPDAWATPGAGPIAGGPIGTARSAASGAVNLPATPAVGNDWQPANGLPTRAGTGTGPNTMVPDSPFRAQPFADAPSGGIRISGVLRQPGGTAAGPAGSGVDTGGRRGGRHGSDDVHVVTGVPVGRSTPPPATPFDVFTPMHRSEQSTGYPPETGYPQAYPDFGAPAPEPGYVSSYNDNSNGGFDHGGFDGFGNGNGFGNNGATEGSYQSEDSDGGAESTGGLPRRVRQASIAPELRAAAAAGPAGSAGVPPASAASLTDMRNTLSAMQRGWQQGRSQSQRDTEGNTVDGD